MTASDFVQALEVFWPKNKAKGLLAQAVLDREVGLGRFGTDATEKLSPGCWLFAPKEQDFYKYRYAFFTHPKVLRSGAAVPAPRELLGDKYRPFHAIAEFLNNAGVGVIYVVTETASGTLPLEEIRNKEFSGISWRFFSFENGGFVPKDADSFLAGWAGTRGRASHGGNWTAEVKTGISALTEAQLTELLLTEIFYAGYVKTTLHKPVNDPYDLDEFIISISQKHVFPVEIKEKFAGDGNGGKYFGIDAGRIMMMLRVCLPNDANAIYLIRELDEQGNFIGWKYMTLSDIVMTSSWNLQAGGAGMGGQATQTIRLPYAEFKDFTSDTLSEDNLKLIGNLPKDIRSMAKSFGEELSGRFHG